MSRAEKVILTNMCMVYDNKGNILVQERVNKDWPGITFPGEHVEPGESFVRSVIREVREETGLTVENPRLCGVKQFGTRDGERYVVLFFKTDRFSGELRSSDEGEVFWIPRSELQNHKLASDFLDMVKVFEDDGCSEFYWSNESGEWKAEIL